MRMEPIREQEQTTSNIMGALPKQLVSRGGILDHLRLAFQKGNREFGDRGQRLANQMGMLKIVIASLPQVFICYNALDKGLLKRFREILKLLSYSSGVPTKRIFPNWDAPCQGRYPTIFPQGSCETHDSQS